MYHHSTCNSSFQKEKEKGKGKGKGKGTIKYEGTNHNLGI
jgi:hypothetical protein